MLGNILKGVMREIKLQYRFGYSFDEQILF